MPPGSSIPEADIELETLALCPLCGGADVRFWRTAHDRLYGTTASKFTYSRCRTCKVRFLSIRPLQSESGKVYPDTYGPYVPEAIRFPTRGTLAAKLRDAYSLPRNGKTLVDYGCGSQGFLDWASARGWETIGIDFSPSVVERVREAGHRALLAGPQELDSIPDSTVGVVRMNHVLEHLYEPDEILRILWRKLAPDGLIHIAVPNPVGVSATIFRSFWLGLEPRHIMLYPPQTLARLLEREGFRGIEIIHEPISKDAARSLAFLMRRRMSPSPDATEAFRRRRPLAILLGPIARLSAAFGRGDRIHCLARK